MLHDQIPPGSRMALLALGEKCRCGEQRIQLQLQEPAELRGERGRTETELPSRRRPDFPQKTGQRLLHILALVGWGLPIQQVGEGHAEIIGDPLELLNLGRIFPLLPVGEGGAGNPRILGYPIGGHTPFL